MAVLWRQGGEGFYRAQVQVGEDGVFERAGKEYTLWMQEAWFHNSRRQALALGWRLVRPQSDEENTWLMKAFYGETYWLGFADNRANGTWQWSRDTWQWPHGHPEGPWLSHMAFRFPLIPKCPMQYPRKGAIS
mgnify:CR=1 FL=1